MTHIYQCIIHTVKNIKIQNIAISNHSCRKKEKYTSIFICCGCLECLKGCTENRLIPAISRMREPQDKMPSCILNYGNYLFENKLKCINKVKQKNKRNFLCKIPRKEATAVYYLMSPWREGCWSQSPQLGVPASQLDLCYPRHLTPRLSCGFLFCKMEIIMLPTSQGCQEDEVNQHK